MVLAYALGFPPVLFGIGSVAAIGFVEQKWLYQEDTVIGLVFTGFLPGLVLRSKTVSHIHLDHILFGHVLGFSG